MAIKTKQAGIVFAIYITLVMPLHAQVFFDDFDDNTNTGWTYLDRSAGTAINGTTGGGPGSVMFVEQNQQLEQTVTNYSFPLGTVDGKPQLGGIALAPGTYESPTLQVDMISFEPGNKNQDQGIIFGYQDEDNFFYVETISADPLTEGSVRVYTIINGGRALLDQADITFSETAATVQVNHNKVVGNVLVTYNLGSVEEFELSVTDPVFQLAGEFSVGVGSNNDAYAIDNFTVVSEFTGSPGDANGDGFVDSLDFQIISSNLFSDVEMGENGDLDFSGTVDFEDFRIWKNAPAILPLASSSAVPEPTSVVLLITSVAVVLGKRRRIS